MPKYEIIVLKPEQQEAAIAGGETAMGGFRTGRVLLKNGEEYFVVINGYNAEYINYVEGYDCVPFSPDDIKEIHITHEVPNIPEMDVRDKVIVEKGFFKDGYLLVDKSVLREL